MADQGEVVRFLMELRALGETEPPTPSLEVATLLAGGEHVTRRHRYRRVAARAALVAAAIVVGLIVAAATHGLPQPAQRMVSNVVNVLTPFEIGPDLPPITTGPRGRTTHPEAPGGQPTKSEAEENPEETNGPSEHRTGGESLEPPHRGEDTTAEQDPSEETQSTVRSRDADRPDDLQSGPTTESRRRGDRREPGDD
jgi:hypothetical protein